MVIQCPKCGRSGNLPDEQVLNAHILRCRKCQSRFVLGAIPIDQAEPSFLRAPHARVLAPVRSAIDGSLSDGYFSGEEEDDPVVGDDLDAGDSHYELPVVIGDDHDEDLADWSADDIPARGSVSEDKVRHANGTNTSADPWYDRLIHTWGRAHFLGVIGLGMVSLTMLGSLVMARLAGNLTAESSAVAVVIAVVAAVALLMISLSTTALNLLLIDLARNMHQHQMRMHADQDAKSPR